MKKYTTFPTDFSTVVVEVMEHLTSTTDIEDVEHQTHAIHYLGTGTELDSAVPSLATAMNGLTLYIAAHVTVTSNAMFNHVSDRDVLFVPLADCSQTVLKLFDVAPGAVLNETDQCYDDADCTVSEVIPLTSPVFIPSGSVFTIENSDLTKLADVLHLSFSEDTSSYFAE